MSAANMKIITVVGRWPRLHLYVFGNGFRTRLHHACSPFLIYFFLYLYIFFGGAGRRIRTLIVCKLCACVFQWADRSFVGDGVRQRRLQRETLRQPTGTCTQRSEWDKVIKTHFTRWFCTSRNISTQWEFKVCFSVHTQTDIVHNW